MSKTRVVHVSNDPFDVYIGRAVHRRGFKASKWGNPFRIGPDGDRDQVIQTYRRYLEASLELLTALPELRGKVLGCWCKPEACHGDVLAEFADGTVCPRCGSEETREGMEWEGEPAGPNSHWIDHICVRCGLIHRITRWFIDFDFDAEEYDSLNSDHQTWHFLSGEWNHPTGG